MAAATALACIPAIALASIENSPQRALSAPGTDDTRTHCGDEQVVTGGGFSIEPNGIEGGSARSQPDGKAFWESRVQAYSGPASTWRNFALCEHASSRAISIETETRKIKNFGARATPTCPDSRHVIGGGYSIRPPADPVAGTGSTLDIVANLRLSRRAWLALGVGDEESDGKLTAFALCEPDRRGAVREVAKRVPVDETGTRHATATCPQGTRVVSGGFNWFGASASIYESKPASTDSWRAALEVFDAPDSDAFLRAIAYCK